MKTELSVESAYKTMFVFLENYYQLTGSDEIGGMLGGMSLLEDGTTADPGMWEDWLDAIKQVQFGKSNICLKITK